MDGDISATTVVIRREPKTENYSSFIIENEDHTLGDLIRMKLVNNERVLFAGYMIPHPLDLKNRMIIRVRTTEDLSPEQALQDAIEAALEEISGLEESFKAEIQSTQSHFSSHYDLY